MARSLLRKKRWGFFLVVWCCSLLFQTRCSSVDVELVIKEKDEICRQIDKDAIALKDSCFDKVVIVIGASGAGKSTLLNLIAGKNPYCKKVNGSTVIEFIDPLEGVDVMHENGEGVTVIPRGFAIDNILFYDSPGLNDADAISQLRNAFVFKKIFEKYGDKKIQCILAVAEEQIKRGGNFKTVLENLGQQFDDPGVSFNKNYCLVVTRSRSWKSSGDVKKSLSAAKLQQCLSQNAKVIFENMVNADVPTALFPEGQLGDMEERGDYYSEEQRNGIKAKILGEVSKIGIADKNVLSHSSDSAPIPFPAPKPCPGPDGMLLAIAIAKMLTQKIDSFVNENILPALKMRCRNILDKGSDVETVRGKLIELNKILGNLKVHEENIVGLKDILILLDLAGPDELNIEKDIEYIKFLRLCNKGIQLNLEQWVQCFHGIKESVAHLSEPPKFMNTDGRITLNAVFLGSKDITSWLQSHREKVERICVYLVHTFYCDADLDCPSISLIIIAPRWFISEAHKISTRGKDGTNGQGNNELDGRPGAPGEHGGHIYGKYLIEASKINLLNIDASGGKGGNGAPGKPGQDCNPSKEPDALPIPILGLPSSLKGTELVKISDSFKDLLSKVDPEKLEKLDIKYIPVLFNSLGTHGKSGGPGGRGGAGADGGKAGKVSIDGVTNIKALDGIRGRDGKGGLSGRPSSGGGNYTGEYWSNLTISHNGIDSVICNKLIRKPEGYFTYAPPGETSSEHTGLIAADVFPVPPGIKTEDYDKAYKSWVGAMPSNLKDYIFTGNQSTISNSN